MLKISVSEHITTSCQYSIYIGIVGISIVSTDFIDS